MDVELVIVVFIEEAREAKKADLPTVSSLGGSFTWDRSPSFLPMQNTTLVVSLSAGLFHRAKGIVMGMSSSEHPRVEAIVPRQRRIALASWLDGEPDIGIFRNPADV